MVSKVHKIELAISRELLEALAAERRLADSLADALREVTRYDNADAAIQANAALKAYDAGRGSSEGTQPA